MPKDVIALAHIRDSNFQSFINKRSNQSSRYGTVHESQDLPSPATPIPQTIPSRNAKPFTYKSVYMCIPFPKT